MTGLAELESGLRWPDLAKDLVLLSLPGTGSKPSLAQVLDDYGMGMGDLSEALASPRFKRLLEAEASRAKGLGPKAGFVLRAEAILAALAERLYQKAMESSASFADVTRAFVAVQQSLAEGKGAQAAGAGTTNILIQVPSLDNAKLRHLERELPVPDDKDGQGSP